MISDFPNNPPNDIDKTSSLGHSSASTNSQMNEKLNTNDRSGCSLPYPNSEQNEKILTQKDKENIETLPKLDNNAVESAEELNQTTTKLLNSRKKIKKVTKCEHRNKEHYAKNLFYNCYHKFGRDKKPWKCEHDILYAKGMCQNCYINQYYTKRKRVGRRSRKAIIKGRNAQKSKVLKMSKRKELPKPEPNLFPKDLLQR